LQVRRPVIGRKNWLFAGSEGGAASGAVLFSLVGSCALHGLDPLAYLEDTMGRIGSHPVNRVIELSPARVAASARAGA
ncbi:MAG: transposase domain-containing protein, partial [Deltaproteobacteria bacterium]|nr:transposase domain-containing protein [Deltaproteobacteria bacterium]